MVGVDLDSIQLYYGKAINKQVNFLKSDIEALPFKGQIFDLVLCNGVIHEIKTSRGRKKLIREFAYILKKQGTLYIADPFAKLRILNFLYKMFRHVNSKIEWNIPRNHLEKTLSRNSFKIVYEEKIESNF